MADIEDIRRKVDKLISEKGLNYRDVSLRIGRKDSYMQQYVKYGYPRRLKEIDRSRLAKLLNVDDSELMDDEVLASKAGNVGDTQFSIIADIIKTTETMDADLAAVEILSPQISNQSFAESAAGKLYINKNILQEFHPYDAAEVKIVKITTEGMKNTVPAGSYVWFDASYQFPETDGLYLFVGGRDLNVRRVQVSPLDGSVEITSDEPNCKVYKADNYRDVKVLGKVVAVLQKV